MTNEDELYQRCIELERTRYALEDKIQDILDYLMKSSITLKEMEELHTDLDIIERQIRAIKRQEKKIDKLIEEEM